MGEPAGAQLGHQPRGHRVGAPAFDERIAAEGHQGKHGGGGRVHGASVAPGVAAQRRSCTRLRTSNRQWATLDVGPQVGAERRGGLVSPIAIACHRAPNDLLERTPQIGVSQAERHRLVLERSAQRLCKRHPAQVDGQTS